MTTQRAPIILAKLDLTDEGQRRLYDFMRRMHTGRWPALRALGMRQRSDGTIVEAVEWIRCAEPRYGLIEWHADGNGLSTLPMPSRRASISAVRSVR